MTWRIDIPYRSRSEALDAEAISGLSRAAPPEERGVVRALLLEARINGDAETVGDVLDTLEQATPTERRGMLDRARVDAGLATTGEVDHRASFKATQQALAGLIERDEAGFAFQTCAHETCHVYPANSAGAMEKSNVRVWWCEQHRGQAAPGDMDPWSPRISYSPSGSLVFGDELEAEREQALAEEERRRRQRAQREAEAEAEGEALDSHEAGLAAYYKPANVGWKPGP